MPQNQLSICRVEYISKQVDAAFQNCYLAVKNFADILEQQSLNVDALFCADISDDRREEFA
jgi:hypothetical protein